MQKDTSYATVFSALALVAVLVFGILAIATINDVRNDMPEMPDVPTAAEIAALVVIPEITQPEYPEFPDTILSVIDEVEEKALELATDELSDRDVREAIVEAISFCEDIDFDRHDITDIKVKDSDVSWYFFSDEIDVDVILDLKVYFDNYGDEAETARVDVTFTVRDLDWKEDYEDTDVEYNNVISPVYSCSTN